MTEFEAAQMVTAFRDAWSDDALSDHDATEVAKCFRAYDRSTVAEVIADRLDAEMGRPGLPELSRVLRAYAPAAAKSDVPPPSEPRRPERPWIASLPELPGPPADLAERMAEARHAHSVGFGLFESRPRVKPEPPVIEMVVVPPDVRQALREGVTAGARARRDRQERTTS